MQDVNEMTKGTHNLRPSIQSNRRLPFPARGQGIRLCYCSALQRPCLNSGRTAAARAAYGHSSNRRHQQTGTRRAQLPKGHCAASGTPTRESLIDREFDRSFALRPVDVLFSACFCLLMGTAQGSRNLIGRSVRRCPINWGIEGRIEECSRHNQRQGPVLWESIYKINSQKPVN